jgi:hypothetical protein
MADPMNDRNESSLSEAPAAQFKSHSGLQVGETRPMLVRKVSSGVCVYAPLPADMAISEEAVDAALDAWIARQFDWRASASRNEYRDDMRAALIAALAKVGA